MEEAKEGLGAHEAERPWPWLTRQMIDVREEVAKVCRGVSLTVCAVSSVDVGTRGSCFGFVLF